MSNNNIEVAKNLAFIDARLSHVRLSRETVTSAPVAPSKEQQQVQLVTETSSGFSIGLDSPEKPGKIAIKIDYTVSLKTQDAEKQVIAYEATHEAQFTIVGWTGFDDWVALPPSAISPYLTVMHDIALKRAEATLFEMGVKGISLPRLDQINLSDELKSSDKSAISEEVQI